MRDEEIYQARLRDAFYLNRGVRNFPKSAARGDEPVDGEDRMKDKQPYCAMHGALCKQKAFEEKLKEIEHLLKELRYLL